MAFAAVVSLKQTIERILLLPPGSKILLPNTEMKLISDELCYLQSFLEAISPPQSSSSKSVEAFERQIKDVVHKLEDLIDFHISDKFLSGSGSAADDGLTFVFSQQLLEFRQEVSSFTKILKTKEECDINRQNQQQSDSSASETTLSRIDYGGNKKKIVGLVVGMAGIGKTIVVKQVYDDPEVKVHFDRCLYVTLGPHYQLKETLLLLLDQLKADNEDLREDSSEDSLSKLVYQILLGKRYLVVLDDVWNTHIREEFKHYLPDEVNQSRIIITSRMRDFDELSMEIPLLNNVESWNLLRDLVFTTTGGSCSPQLEKIGKEIAKKCEGLPLAIIEVGKLLRKKEKTVEEWQFIADKEDPLTIKSDDNTPLSNALLLSYTMLPQYLKVCFLYMSVFPKGYEISRSKLTKLLVAEGILEPQKNKNLEETADECLNELISHSVVMKKKQRSRGKRTTKTCKLHFTFRNLCVNEAKSENFFHVINKYPDSFPEGIDSQRRLCAHNNIVLGFEQAHIWMESVSGARSLLCYGPKQQYPIRLYLPFRLLKVLDAVLMRFYEFPHQVVELFHLRYLAVTSNGEIPSSISRLSNLEILIIHQHHRVIKSSNSPVYLPVEIWKLHKLKHLVCMGFDLPDPSPANDDSLILEKLLTISGVGAHSCTKRVLTRIPNLTKLGIRIETKDDDETAAVEALSFLGGGDRFASVYEEFESFKCVVINPSLVRCQIVPNFPANISKISLSGCGFPWENMRAIAELPNLRVLKLRWCAFSGPEWEMRRENRYALFNGLEFLLMEDLDIQQWRVESYQFPNMNRLIIRHCYKLTAIPIFGLHYSLKIELISEQKLNSRWVYFGLRVKFSGDGDGDDDDGDEKP
ncbi:hypothetical protein MIMGU_mgv1a001216mg [Erythranthe guttata]|uniref:Uncharacterized protein n=1 Tax=Erythranthe guttata TaxID=4155 RepID=A0A022Q3J0_ERYGU|nr:hypothetical protein MIMGU_mgv1a001216mg [Erythranthe guttata]